MFSSLSFSFCPLWQSSIPCLLIHSLLFLSHRLLLQPVPRTRSSCLCLPARDTHPHIPLSSNSIHYITPLLFLFLCGATNKSWRERERKKAFKFSFYALGVAVLLLLLPCSSFWVFALSFLLLLIKSDLEKSLLLLWAERAILSCTNEDQKKEDSVSSLFSFSCPSFRSPLKPLFLRPTSTTSQQPTSQFLPTRC